MWHEKDHVKVWRCHFCVSHKSLIWINLQRLSRTHLDYYQPSWSVPVRLFNSVERLWGNRSGTPLSGKKKRERGRRKRGKENFPQIPRKFLYVDSEQILHRNVPMSTALNHQKFLNAKNCVGGARENNSIFSFFFVSLPKIGTILP